MGTPAISLRVGSVVSASGTLTAGQLTPVSASSGPLLMTLPTPSNASARVSVVKTDNSQNNVVVTGTINGTSTSITLAHAYATVDLIADSANGGWWTVGGLAAGGANKTINVTAPQWGVKGDGIIVNDLVVTGGSKTITSNTAPFISTAVDKGKLVLYCTGAATAIGVIDTVQSATSATLVDTPPYNNTTAGGPNPNGIIGTDNTAALNAVFSAVQAPAIAAGSNRRESVPLARVYMPTGTYVTRPLTPFTMPNGAIFGDGRRSTRVIAAANTGNLFQHGTLDANATDAYQGTAFNWYYSDIFFSEMARMPSGYEGRRGVVGIADYGCGGIHVRNCEFTGFSMGFGGAHGSDFSDFNYCFFANCDVGTYVGPGSQQVDFLKCDWTICQEGIVFEGAPHWHIGGASSWEDNTVSCVTLEAKNSGKTRMGVNPNIGGAFYFLSASIDGSSWFETNSGGNGRVAPRIIYMNGDGPFGQGAGGITIRDATVIAGGNQQSGGTVSFFESNSAYTVEGAVVIENVVISNPSYLNYLFRNTGSAEARPILTRNRYPGVVTLTAGTVTPRITNVNGTMRGYSNY